MNQPPPRPTTIADVDRKLTQLTHDVGQLVSEVRRTRNSEIPRARTESQDFGVRVDGTLLGVARHADGVATSIAAMTARLESYEASRRNWTRKRLLAIGVGAFVATLLYNLGLQVIR